MAENNASHSSDGSKTTAVKTFPPLDTLIKEAWEVFKKSALNLFILNIVIILIWFGVLASLVVVLVAFGMGAGVFKTISEQGFNNALVSLAPSLIWIIVIFVPVFIIAAIIIGSMQQAGTILILSKYREQISFKEIFGKSFGLVIPLFLVSLILFLILVGGAFLFIIPMILFQILFVFTNYEVVLGNKKGVSALKGSMAIVMSNFGEVFVRILFLIVINIGFALISYIFAGIFKNIQGINLLMNIGIWIISIALGWYSACYSIVLYNQSKAVSDPDKKVSMTWVWIIAIVGWIIAIALIIVAVVLMSSFSRSSAFKNAFENLPNSQYNQKALPTFPFPTTGFYIPPSETTNTF